MSSTEPTAEELEKSREHRVAVQRLARQHVQVAYLRLAQRYRSDNGLDPTLIAPALQQAQDELDELQRLIGGRIDARKKAKVDSTQTCTIYIDECGSHSLTAVEAFEAFCLAAVIVRDQDRTAFESKWDAWKLLNLGSDKRLVHEPDVRKRAGTFNFRGSRPKYDAVLASLSEIIKELEFTAIVCVLHRPQYVKEFGIKALDESLPGHGYLMTLHFMAERLAMALQKQFGGAKARLILESRGPSEDALMQYEFARLFLDGTSYLSASYFRRQFFPGLEFKLKSDHVAGLEITDLLARPVGEKVLRPKSDPARWQSFRNKLCTGLETKHSILGLKIVPWNDAYIDLWKS